MSSFDTQTVFMIASVLQYIRLQLEDYLKRETETDDSLVKIAGLGAHGSTSPVPDNGLTISVVNIENDKRIAHHATPVRDRPYLSVAPFYLDISFLLSSSVNADEYLQGLHLLSVAMNFFQNNPLFTTGLPAGLEKLPVELVSIDMDRMNGLWLASGRAYRPSVMYKLRMLRMNDTDYEVLPPVVEIKK